MILRRAVTATALLAACVLVLQVNDSIDSIPKVVASPQLESQAPFGMAAGSDHEFYLAHSRIIPVGRRSISVPILMYHYIRPAPDKLMDRLGWNLTTTPQDFQAQMTWLAVSGFHPVDFNDLRAYFAGRTPLPNKPVVITFDDGYADLYTTAYPILRSMAFKAVAYIVTSFVGQPRYVTAAQVVEMDHSGIEIGSHTINHADLARASLYLTTYQLTESKAWLEELIGHSVVDFAYPSGKFSTVVIGALEATGYDTAVTELPGTIHSRTDRYTWTRVRVGGGETLGAFIDYLGPVEPSIEVTSVATTQ